MEKPNSFTKAKVPTSDTGRVSAVMSTLRQPCKNRKMTPMTRRIASARVFITSWMEARTASVVSLDGYKASFLAEAANEYRERGLEDFVAIGHPKAQTPYSIDALDRFLGSLPKHDQVTTFAACA